MITSSFASRVTSSSIGGSHDRLARRANTSQPLAGGSLVTRITTPYKVYHVHETLDKVVEMMNGLNPQTSYITLHITPEGRTVGQIPVVLAVGDIRAVEYQ